MKRWGLAMGIGLMGLGGCSSDDEGASDFFGGGAGGGGPTYWVVPAGQTGSLIPGCGAIPALTGRTPVPSGDSAFVIYDWEGCDPDIADSIMLQRADGSEVPLQLEPVGDRQLLVRSSQVLEPGEYGVEVLGEPRDSLIVSDVAQLPIQLGTLSVAESYNCGVVLDLELSADAVRYASLMRLSVSIDGAPPELVYDFGMVAEREGHVDVELQGTFPSGRHHFHVSVEIAGEDVVPQPTTLDPILSCGDGRDETSTGPSGDGGGCATSSRGRSANGGQTGLLTALLAVGAGIRRRSRRRETAG